MIQNIVTSGAKAPMLSSFESARLKPRPFKATYFSQGLRTRDANTAAFVLKASFNF
jgi:hypothetical protein